ncbi:hypothetical protein HDR60_03205 [bacterium]|nr:hypothetical protein [bacterium]
MYLKMTDELMDMFLEHEKQTRYTEMLKLMKLMKGYDVRVIPTFGGWQLVSRDFDANDPHLKVGYAVQSHSMSVCEANELEVSYNLMTREQRIERENEHEEYFGVFDSAEEVFKRIKKFLIENHRED